MSSGDFTVEDIRSEYEKQRIILSRIRDPKRLGEAAKPDEFFKWLYYEMDYDDFSAFAKLSFREKQSGYAFNYRYMIERRKDSPKAREEYIRYLMWKLAQNVLDPNIELEGKW